MWVCLYRALVIQHTKRIFSAHHYIVICGLSGCTIVFPHYVINGSIFEKKIFNHKMSVLIFVTTFSETFLILRRIQRDIIINGIGFHVKYSLFLSRFNQIGISGQIYKKKSSNTKFHESLSSGNRVDPGWQIDEANSRFSQLYLSESDDFYTDVSLMY